MGRRNRGTEHRLHQLYLIADVGFAQSFDVDLVGVVEEFVSAGGRMVSLRCTEGDDRYLLEVGKEIAGLLYAVRGTFLVHRRVDLAMLLGADGVHLPSKGFSKRELEQLMGRAVLGGRSCHSAEEIQRWQRVGGDFATLGPLFSSISKPEYGPQWEAEEFRDVARSSQVFIYALGGVVPENVHQCFEAGASGVAVVGGIMGAASPFEATQRYLEAIDEVF